MNAIPVTRQEGYLQRTIGDLLLEQNKSQVVEVYCVDGPCANEVHDIPASVHEMQWDVQSNLHGAGVLYERAAKMTSCFEGTAMCVLLLEDRMYCTSTFEEPEERQIHPRVVSLNRECPPIEDDLISWLRWQCLTSGLQTADTVDELDEFHELLKLPLETLLEMTEAFA